MPEGKDQASPEECPSTAVSNESVAVVHKSFPSLLVLVTVSGRRQQWQSDSWVTGALQLKGVVDEASSQEARGACQRRRENRLRKAAKQGTERR